MKLIAIIATAAMAIGLYTAAEASMVSEAKHEVTCQQDSVVTCRFCFGRGKNGPNICNACRGRGITRANGTPL